MKAMKYSIFSIIIGAIVLFSCTEDFLERVPLDYASLDNYPTNEAQAETLVNGIYNKLDFGGTTHPYQKVYPYYLDAITDNVFNRSPWEGMTDFARGQAVATNMHVNWKWESNYQGVTRANAFLNAIDEAGIESDKIPRMKAESKFLRAWFYNDLVTYYGDVPLVLLPGDLSNAQPDRTPKSEVVTQILKDLDEAIPDLPTTYELEKDKGRVTKGAALAFKARVLLYNSRWAEAAAAAKECMDLQVYSLYPDYYGLFQEANEAAASNTEIIFQVYYTPVSNPSYYTTTMMIWWPSYLPTLQLVNSYYMKNGFPITDTENSGYDPANPHMNRDPRLGASIIVPGGPFKLAVWGVNEYIPFPNWVMAGSGFKPRKFVNETLTNTETGEGTNKYFIRYAEVLLTYAEAQNEASGPDPSVYAAIDELRERAGMATLTVAMPGLSQEKMREVIRNERRVELAFEGLRWPDIQRWKIGEEVIVDAMGYDHTSLTTYPGDNNGTSAEWQYVTKVIDFRSFNPAKDYLWPIPQNEMNSNTNMVQNPGY
jgi:hypothetical protein